MIHMISISQGCIWIICAWNCIKAMSPVYRRHRQLVEPYVSYAVLFAPSYMWCLGVPLEARSQQKIWCLHMFLYSVPLFSRVDVVWLCAPEEGRLFVGACCVWFVVMIPHHEAFVYIPPPKNRGSLWQHHRRLTCDMLERFRSERVTPSPNLLSLPSLFAFFHSSFTITFSLWGFPLVFWALISLL